MSGSRFRSLASVMPLLIAIIIPGAVAQSATARLSKRAIQRALIERVEGPSLLVRTTLAPVNKHLRDASLNAEEALSAMQEVLSITTQADVSDPTSNAVITSINSVSQAGAMLAPVPSLTSNVHNQLARTEDVLSVSGIGNPSMVSDALMHITQADDGISEISAAVSSAQDELTTASTALNSLSGSAVVDPQILIDALAGLANAEVSISELLSAASDADDQLSEVMGTLSEPGILTPAEVADVLEDLLSIDASTSTIRASISEINGHLADVGSILGSIPTIPLDLSPVAKTNYKSGIVAAKSALKKLAASLDAIHELAVNLKPKIARTVGVVQSLSIEEMTTTHKTMNTDLPPEVQSLLDEIFGAVDGITDMEVTSGDTEIPLDESIDELREMYASTYDDVYTSAPPTVQGGLTTAMGAIETLTDINASVETDLFDVASSIDSLISEMGPVVLSRGGGGNSDCDADDPFHGITYYYGTPGPDECDGSSGPDIFWMYGGADTVHGMGSGDTLHLLDGGDAGHGTAGNDLLLGSNGDDDMWGGYGNDRMKDEQGRDVDVVYGGPGVDDGSIKDGDKQDYWFGGEGHDIEPLYDKCRTTIGGGCVGGQDFYSSAHG